MCWEEAVEAWSSPSKDIHPLRHTLTRGDVWRHISAGCVGLLLVYPGAAVAGPKKAKWQQELGSVETGIGPCLGQPVKKSCWSTEDTQGRRMRPLIPPPSASVKDIVADIESVMAAYPQSGQTDVDMGGNRLGEKNVDAGRVYLRYEFTSGKFKYVDDVEFFVDDRVVSVRSASRTGGYDYGVNATRLNYILKQLEAKGWKVTLI